MNDFNPFDNLGISFDNKTPNESRRDKAYHEKWNYNPFDSNDNIKVNLNTEPTYQPDFEKPLVNVTNPKDLQISQELWVSIPEPMPLEERQAYVDALSNEDWKTWKQLKSEGYSFEARKAMMDNKDLLYDITAPGNEKFWSWKKNSFMQYLLDQEQSTLGFQNDVIHPWSVSTQEKLNTISQNLMAPTYEDIYNKLETDYAWNNWNKSMAWVLRWVNIAWWVITNLASKWVSLIDSLWNLSTQFKGEILNAIADDKKWYNEFIVDPSQSVSLRASQIEAVNDIMWWFYALKYPIATYLITLIWGESEEASKILQWATKWIDWVNKQVVNLIGEDNLWLEWLTDKEKQLWYENLLMAEIGLFGEWLGRGWKKFSNTKLVQETESALKFANETSKFAKRTAENEIAQWVKWAMKDLPEWAQLTTEGWTPLFSNTLSGIKPTIQWELYLLTKVFGARANWFIRWLERVYKNKDRWLVTRNPKEPVWDLPVTPWVKIDNWTPKIEDTRIKPVEEPKVEAPKQEIKTTTPKPVATTKPVEKTSTIKEFIKSVKEDLESPKSWISKELSEKIQTSPALQSEYVNTIDPYIRANGASNPSWVIEQPLRDFINTVLEELNYQRFSEVDKNKINQKTKVNIPVQDKVRYESQQQEYKDLIKILSKDYDNPEEYLKYLLNLKPQTVKTLDRLIPDFSKNLWLIKDTLDLTKAITSTDLLWKLLDWKSNWWWRNKASIRNYLWRKFAEAYKNSSTKTRMAEVENILNQMSEEELVNLEKQMNDNLGIRRYDWRAEWYMPETMWEKGNISFKEAWNKKRPWTNKTIWEMYEKYKAKITLAKDESDYRLITKDMPWHESLAAYSENLDRFIFKELNNPNEQFFYHEWYHRVFNQLGTNKMLNILEYISKRDNISQEAAFERRAEYWRNYVRYNNIDWKRYILKELGEAFDSKLLSVMEKTKDELFDLFNINNLQELEINQIISDVKHDTKAWEEIMNRKPQPILSKLFDIQDPRKQRWDVDYRRLFLQRINPEVERVRMDYDQAATNPYAMWNVVIEMKDWSTQTWEQFKKNMTKEQLEKEDIYMEEVLDDIISQTFNVEKQSDWEYWFAWEGKFDYKTLQNEKQLDYSVLSKKWFTETKDTLWIESLEAMDLLTQLKQIDPDIVGLKEKNWKLMVEYLVEWYSERRELPDRPWQLEVKEAPARDYLSKEEIESLPKDFQDMVTKDEWLYQGWQWWLQYSEWKNLKLGNWYYFGNYKQAKEFGPALIELEKNDWKLKEYKDTQEYQVEASKNGWKEEFNKKLKEEWYDWIKAYNRSFKTDEYNFFENPFKKNLVTNKK